MSSGWKLVLVSSWFQVVWLLSVVGQTRFQWLALILSIVTILVSHRILGLRLKSLVLLVILGIAIDSLNTFANLLVFDTDVLPVWLVALWLIFSWYAFYLKTFLIPYPILLVSVVGGLGGAMSYLAGFKLGAVSTQYPMLVTLGVLFIEWVLIVFLIVRYPRPNERSWTHET
ncbi:hypothetical protein VTH8203_00706 [Vibrio thalassae]|uniref:Zinc ABC transporter permease n=1 Tax=Vibrio thalassae TaxID=1243014 RepID=A0A240EGL3_9VIBR|nr:DUF2878 domain-containing protein [Vibrio thalassae]SNX47105.1 hypothetical protein VTH8203_00706 [Vibrio thalassae]